MSKKVNYKKIVKKLNNEISAKYDSLEVRNVFPEFEYETCRDYLTLEMDDYNGELILFQNMIIYGKSYHSVEGQGKEEVTIYVKEWFNNYLETMAKLKFK